MVADLLDEIDRYTKSVLDEAWPCGRKQCPGCAAVSDSFARHDRRTRTFWVIVERLVRRIPSFVIRYRCRSCGVRFTDLPPFAQPHKRYVHDHIFASSERYVEDEQATYRSVVRDQGLPIFHRASSPNTIDDRVLAPSTAWRWITSLSLLEVTLRRALEMIRGLSPSSSLFRRALLLPFRKYRSEARKIRLEILRRLIHADQEYCPLFGGSIFPGLATAMDWT